MQRREKIETENYEIKTEREREIGERDRRDKE